MKNLHLNTFRILLGMLCMNLNLYGQGFNNTYGTADNNEFRSVVQLPGGDYVASGVTYTGTSGNFYIARIDQQGDIVWQTTFGGTGNDVAHSSVLNTNGNVVIAGSSNSYSSNGTTDILIIEINADGVVQWAKNYGTTANLHEVPNKINLTSGGIGIAGTSQVPGSTTHDMLAFEISNNGATVNWQKTYQGNGELAYHLISSSSGGYILAGGSNTAGTKGVYDQLIVRLNSTGGILSTRSFGGTDNENAQQVIELPNNELIVMGNIRALSGTGMDISLVKIKADNSIEWAKSYGDLGTGNERAYAILPTSTGGYVMAGTTTGFGHVGGGNNDIILVKTDANGVMTNYKTYGGTGNDLTLDFVQNSEGSYTIASYSNSQGAGGMDAGLIKTLPDLTTPGSCSPSTVLSKIINPAIGTMSFTATTIALAISNVASNSSTVSYVKNVVPPFSVSGLVQVCANSQASFTISKPGATASWSHTGTATVQTNSASNYALTYTQSGIDTITATYGSCSSSLYLSVTSTPLSFVGLNNLYNEGNPPINLVGSPSGGSFTVNGSLATVFQCTVSGSYEVEYIFTDANNCVNRIEKTVVVDVLDCDDIVLEFTGLEDFYCVGTAAFDLEATPGGGNFTIDGTPATQFQSNTAGTYAVTYHYSDLNGCSTYLTKMVTVSNLSFTANETVICPGNPVTFTATQCIPGTYNKYRYYINGEPVGPSTNSNTITLSDLQDGDEVSVYAFNTENSAEILSAPVTIEYAAVSPNAAITISSTNLFCNATNVNYPIGVTPATTGAVLAGTGVTGTNFNPFGLTPGIYSITYTVTINGCNFVTSKIVNVLPSPIVTLTSSETDNKVCKGTPVIFTANSGGTASRYLFLVNGTGKQGPGTDNTFDIFTLENGDVVTVTSDNGANTCTSNSAAIATTVGIAPVANFDWKSICGGNSSSGYQIQFSDLSSSSAPSVISNWAWDTDGDGSFEYTYSNANAPLSAYPTLGAFNAKLKLTTPEGCISEITKQVFTLGEMAVTNNDPYSIIFAVSDGGWKANGINSSWSYGISSDFPSDGNIWVTKNASNRYNVNEKSYLNSPCYDFTNLEQPAIRLTIWAKTTINAGALLQASTDGGTTWFLIGEKGEGTNWYDDSGNNGVDDFMESNSNNDAWYGFYSGWKAAIIMLPELAGESSVRFRIAFGSSAATQTTQGFALGGIELVNSSINKIVDVVESDFKIYPNPAQHETTVILGKTINSVLNWQLVDALGRIVNKGNVESGVQNFVLDISAQTPGLYTLKINPDRGNVMTEKIIVRR